MSLIIKKKNPQEYINSQTLIFVLKDKNITKLPQCQPIEDFIRTLSEKVYKNNQSGVDDKLL